MPNSKTWRDAFEWGDLPEKVLTDEALKAEFIKEMEEAYKMRLVIHEQALSLYYQATGHSLGSEITESSTGKGAAYIIK